MLNFDFECPSPNGVSRLSYYSYIDKFLDIEESHVETVMFLVFRHLISFRRVGLLQLQLYLEFRPCLLKIAGE